MLHDAREIKTRWEFLVEWRQIWEIIGIASFDVFSFVLPWEGNHSRELNTSSLRRQGIREILVTFFNHRQTWSVFNVWRGKTMLLSLKTSSSLPAEKLLTNSITCCALNFFKLFKSWVVFKEDDHDLEVNNSFESLFTPQLEFPQTRINIFHSSKHFQRHQWNSDDVNDRVN